MQIKPWLSALALLVILAPLATLQADTINAPDQVSQCAQKYPATAHMLARREAETGIPWRVVMAIAVVESNCNPLAIGRMGEVGAFQEMPREVIRGRPWRSELLWPQPVLYVDGEQNRMMIQALEAHKLLQRSMVARDRNLRDVLREYNCGNNRGAVCDRYAERVLALAGWRGW